MREILENVEATLAIYMTLTSPVSLIQCLISIREYAFVSSPYPVVITLEDHLTPELQAKVAESESEEEDENIKSVQAGVVKYKRLITISAGKPKGGLKEALKVDPDKVQRLSISEQQLEKAAGSLGFHFVRQWQIYIAGVPADEAKRKTKVIEDDWIPVWGEEFTFSLTVPELALLRIEVREYDLHGGQTCLPIPELKTGIRSVTLHDMKRVKYKKVRLLMFFEFEEIV
ncbi:Phosphoinositide phospholipase C 7 [Hibiscus syriacus]|uniref:Phosphoinositide phospholipase C 7 n=1 Tax=Hibiscus syriacus TaxID=106335 RepID=A0A6A3B1L0_HIBSY|nr:Phosphoinositide phospholipase C 7 [Hibiscus syriacus]